MNGMLAPGLLTLDVEDWHHANFHQLDPMADRIRATVRERRYRMDRNVELWMETLAVTGAKSTCFVLGEFAEAFPEAVRKLHEAGHEVASHGATHDLIYRMSQEQFREYLKKGIGALGNLIGKSPEGFRAPSWSVDQRTPWYLDELREQGIRYDSSIFPVKTTLYGQGDAPLTVTREKGIVRVPVTVLTVGPLRLPFASGAFFRLAPLPLIRHGLARASKLGQTVMLVLHPRELDPEHPRLPLSGWERSVHYARLKTTLPKLRDLLPRYRWGTIAGFLRDGGFSN